MCIIGFVINNDDCQPKVIEDDGGLHKTELMNNDDDEDKWVTEYANPGNMNYIRLQEEVKARGSDRNFVLKACAADGRMLDFVSKEYQSDREIVMAAINSYNALLRYYFRNGIIAKVKSPRDSILTRVEGCGFHLPSPLQYASKELQADRNVVLSAVRIDGGNLEFASPDLQNDREVVLTALSQFRFSLRFASPTMRNDEEIVLAAIEEYPFKKKKKSRSYLIKQSDRIYEQRFLPHSRVAVHENVQFASSDLMQDRKFMLAAVKKNGNVLEFAPEAFRADKEMVIAAVESNPSSLQFALNGLNQDKKCLIAAKIWDDTCDDVVLPNRTKLKKRIVLSTKFSLSDKSSPNASRFTVVLKQHPYIDENFIVYSPNAFAKGTCDPDWTRIDWRCRGTYDTCEMEEPSLKDGPPQDGCCWRYSFRYQLEDAKRLGGFMIQVVNCEEDLTPVLGQGQRIEIEMAQAVGIKVFRVYQPVVGMDYRDANGPDYYRVEEFADNHISKLVDHVTSWYKADCDDMSLCEVLNQRSGGLGRCYLNNYRPIGSTEDY